MRPPRTRIYISSTIHTWILRIEFMKIRLKERSEACHEVKSINADPCLARLPKSSTTIEKVPSPPQLPTTQDDFFHTLHLFPMSLHRQLDIHTKPRGLPAYRNRRKLRRRPNFRPPRCTLKLQLIPSRTPLILRRLPPDTVSTMCAR
jgi:hypothetical protein